MSTIKLIFAGIGSALGIAVVVLLAIFGFKITGELHNARIQQATADSVKWLGLSDALVGRLSLLDRNAAQSRTVFVQARDAQNKNPVVTGGGKKADSIANAAVNACYEKGIKAVTDCEKARKTADSLPAMRDSLAAARVKLAGLKTPPRWTASAGVFYAWPMNAPMIRAETQFKLPIINTSATAGADYLLIKSPTTPLDSIYSKQKWRYYLGASIPFR